MSERNRSVVRMQFGDGSKIESWLSFTMRDTYTDPLGSLEFMAAPPPAQISDYLARLAKGELVTVFANDVNQGTFIITSCQRSHGVNGTIFSVTCKTPLVTAQEGSADPTGTLSFSTQTDTPLGQIILAALTPYGFDQLLADDAANVSALTGLSLSGKAANVTPDTLKTQEAQAQEGEKAYQFCARLLSRRGVAMRMDVDGRLLLTVPDYTQAAAYQVVLDYNPSTPGDRFLGDPPVTIVDTNDDQFADCRVRGLSVDKRGRTQSAQPEAIITSAEMNPTRPAYTSNAAAHKRLEILDKECRDEAQCRSVAKLALGIRARGAFQVVGEVDGFVAQTGAIWSVNTVAHVIVAPEEIDEEMWLFERVLIQDKEKGQRTRLTFLPKGALVLGDVQG